MITISVSFHIYIFTQHDVKCDATPVYFDQNKMFSVADMKSYPDEVLYLIHQITRVLYKTTPVI